MGTELTSHQDAEAAMLLPGDEALGDPWPTRLGCDAGKGSSRWSDQRLRGEPRIGGLEHPLIGIFSVGSQRRRRLQQAGFRRDDRPILGQRRKAPFVMEFVQQGEVTREYTAHFAELIQAMRQIEYLLTSRQHQVDLLRPDCLQEGLAPSVHITTRLGKA